jgi:flagella basal body P-ring formation protein FlgA
MLSFANQRILLLAALCIPTPLLGAVIDVQETAKPVAGLIRLGDIARIDDADPKVARQLAGVTLGPAPAEGRKLRITQQAIRERLIANGVNLAEVEFAGQSLILIEGPPVARAQPPAKPLPSKLVPVAAQPRTPTPVDRRNADEIVQTAFHRQFQFDEADIGPPALIVKIDDGDVALLGETDSEQIQFIEPGLAWGGPQTLTARIPAEDGESHVVRLRVWLEETPRVLTVKHAIPKGQVLRDADLVAKPAAKGETGIERADALVGREATRTLRPGAPLQHADVVKTPLVRSNDLVTVRVRLPGLTVSRIFRSQGHGAEGEVVNLVALEDPREKVQARVTGWHEAEIVSAEVSSTVSSRGAR